MAYNTLLLETNNHITVLSLNQPQTRNALSMEMKEEFHSAIEAVKKINDSKVLVIEGRGKSFCSGGDLESIYYMFNDTPARTKNNLIDYYQSFLSLRELDIPTIAMVNGYAVGAGFCLALACDMRIAAADAQLAMSFIKLGLHPGMGASYLLPRLAGTAIAFELFLTGKTISGEEAFRLGLVNHVVDAEKLRDFTMDFAAQIASNPVIPARYIKKSVYQNLTSDLNAALDYEASAQSFCAGTEDMKEGLAAIKEKRTPVFKGAL